MPDRSHCRSDKFDAETDHYSERGGNLVAFVLWLADRWQAPWRRPSLTGHEAILAYDLAVLDLKEQQMAGSDVSMSGGGGDPRMHPFPSTTMSAKTNAGGEAREVREPIQCPTLS